LHLWRWAVVGSCFLKRDGYRCSRALLIRSRLCRCCRTGILRWLLQGRMTPRLCWTSLCRRILPRPVCVSTRLGGTVFRRVFCCLVHHPLGFCRVNFFRGLEHLGLLCSRGCSRVVVCLRGRSSNFSWTESTPS
jgi:hypothetical protein